MSDKCFVIGFTLCVRKKSLERNTPSLSVEWVRVFITRDRYLNSNFGACDSESHICWNCVLCSVFWLSQLTWGLERNWWKAETTHQMFLRWLRAWEFNSKQVWREALVFPCSLSKILADKNVVNKTHWVKCQPVPLLWLSKENIVCVDWVSEVGIDSSSLITHSQRPRFALKKSDPATLNYRTPWLT